MDSTAAEKIQPLSPSISSSDAEMPIEISNNAETNGQTASQSNNETSEAENGRAIPNQSNETGCATDNTDSNTEVIDTNIPVEELPFYNQRVTLKPRKVPTDLAKTLQLGVKETTKLYFLEKWIRISFTEKLAGQDRKLVSITLAPLSWYGYGKKILIGDGKTMLSAAKPMAMVCPAEPLDMNLTIAEYRFTNNIAPEVPIELAFDVVVA